MNSVRRSRVVLILSLAVLSGSVAVFASATGIASPATVDTRYDFSIQDGALIETSGGTNETLVADVRTVERIEITNLDTTPVVRTYPRDWAELNRSKRERAKKIVTTEEGINEALETANDAVYTIRPIPKAVQSNRAAIVGADPETPRRRVATSDVSSFTIRNNTADATVVIERTDQQLSDRRALVVVDPIDQDIRYSVVVDLRNETIDAFVRLRGVAQ